MRDRKTVYNEAIPHKEAGMKWLGKYSDHAYALLRILSGILFAFHGAQKLFGVLGGQPPPLFSQRGLAGIIEFFGGLAIALGLGTRIAAFIASGEMAVAYFQVHWRMEMTADRFFPVMNAGELALLYCFLFLFIATRGTVKWGLMKRS
jgi:putative oxidoreductase